MRRTQETKVIGRGDQSPLTAVGKEMQLQMLSHANDDVRAAVLACFCQVIRITTPNKPYSDETMKLVFQQIVECLRRIDNLKRRSYMKKVSILELLAEVRSCIIMLNLELHDLILKMFQCFLQRIRSENKVENRNIVAKIQENGGQLKPSPVLAEEFLLQLEHLDKVFCFVEKIMTTVININESQNEVICKDLVSCLLWSVRRERMVHFSVSSTLGATVVCRCVDKLKQVLHVLVGDRTKEYSASIVSLCQTHWMPWHRATSTVLRISMRELPLIASVRKMRRVLKKRRLNGTKQLLHGDRQPQVGANCVRHQATRVNHIRRLANQHKRSCNNASCPEADMLPERSQLKRKVE